MELKRKHIGKYIIFTENSQARRQYNLKGGLIIELDRPNTSSCIATITNLEPYDKDKPIEWGPITYTAAGDYILINPNLGLLITHSVWN